MIGSLLARLTKNWPIHKLIANGDDVYLIRYRLFATRGDSKDGWRLFLHHFMRSDRDRELHNHPWHWAYSLILSGGYLEERREGDVVVQRAYTPGMLNSFKADTFHRVELLDSKECWSLIVTGPITQSWGFWDRKSKTFTPWRDFAAPEAA